MHPPLQAGRTSKGVFVVVVASIGLAWSAAPNANPRLIDGDLPDSDEPVIAIEQASAVPEVASSAIVPKERQVRDAAIAPALDLSRGVIRKAIADSEEPSRQRIGSPAGSFGGVAPAGQARIDRAFQQADIPTCMTMDAYKFDRPHIGPIPIPGFFAAPWLVHAIVTGRCRH